MTLNRQVFMVEVGEGASYRSWHILPFELAKIDELLKNAALVPNDFYKEKRMQAAHQLSFINN